MSSDAKTSISFNNYTHIPISCAKQLRVRDSDTIYLRSVIFLFAQMERTLLPFVDVRLYKILQSSII